MEKRRSFGLQLVSHLVSLSLFTAFNTGACFAADADYARGVTLYTAGKYKDAIDPFSKSIQRDPKNSAAYYCLAQCLLMTGQASTAQTWFQAIITRFPNSPHAGLARTAMAKVSGAGRSGARSVSPGDTSSGSAADATPAEIPHPSGGYIDPQKIMVVVPPKADRPAVSAKFLKNIRAALSTMPRATVSYLYEQGCRVYVTPTLIDKNPELLNTHPHGYEEGHTYKQAPAIFDGTNVVVCEYAFDSETEALNPTADPVGSVRHEFGHAVDRYLGYLSYKPDFRHTYYLDVGRMTPEEKEKLNYYTQKADSGPAECFAEVYSGITGGPAPNTPYYSDQNKQVMTNFQGVRGYVQKALDKM